MAKNMYQKREERKNKKMNEDGKSFSNVSINWYPGHMHKTKREIKEKINLIDIVYEVIDARMPLSSKIADIDEIIKDKPKILIMTKYDMCDKEKTDKFITFYEDKGYHVIPVDLIKNVNVNKILIKSRELLVLLNEQRRKKGMKPRSIRTLVIGVPNVGKSTLINRLAGSKKTQVGNRPGVTKNLGWIRLNKEIELLDTPGILWPKIDNQEYGYNLASLSSIKEEILNKEDIAIYILKKMISEYPNNLEERYGISTIDFGNISDTLDIIAKKRGALLKGGYSDYEKVYLIIIRDLKEGYLGNITFD